MATTVTIVFNEYEIIPVARRVLDLAREQSTHFRAACGRGLDGFTRMVVWSQDEAAEDVFSIALDSVIAFRERALYLGIAGLPREYYSGAYSLKTNEPIPDLNYLDQLYEASDWRSERAGQRFVTPGWISDAAARGALDGKSAMNKIAEEFYYILEHGDYKAAPKRGGAKPDTSLWLGDDRKAWLREHGGIQPIIHALIDRAMAEAGD